MSYSTWVFDDHDECGYSYKCSSCGCIIATPSKYKKPEVCPRCGDTMTEPKHFGTCGDCEYLDKLVCRLTGKYRIYDDPCNCADGGLAR